MQLENAGETSRLSASVSEWKARSDAATKAAAKETERLEARHADALARLQDELAELRGQSQAAALSQARAEVSLTERLSEIEKARDAAASERDQLHLLLGQVERDKAFEVSSLRVSLAETQARFDAALAAGSAEKNRMKEESLAAISLLQDELAGLRKQAEVAGLEHASQTLALGTRMSVLETEKAGLDKERDDLVARLRAAEALHGQAQLASEKRVAALERQKAQEATRLGKTVTKWQARFETAARASAKDAQNVATRHATLVARLQEKAAHLKEQGATAAKEAKSLARQVSALEREKALLSAEQEAAEVRLRHAEEGHQEAMRLAEERAAALRREALDEAGRGSAAIAEWQSRFDAATLAAVAQTQRVEAQHEERVERLEGEVAQILRQREAAAERHESEASAFREQIRSLEKEKAAALIESRESQTQLRKREESHREELRLSEQRVAASQIEKVEESARLNAAVAEMQSRLSAAAAIQLSEAQAASERVALLERERSETLAERQELQEKLRQREESHREELRLSEQRVAAVGEAQAKEVAGLTERLSWIESERARAIAQRDSLEGQLHHMEARQSQALRLAEAEARPRAAGTIPAAMPVDPRDGPPEFDESRTDGGIGVSPVTPSNEEPAGTAPKDQEETGALPEWEYERIFRKQGERERVDGRDPGVSGWLDGLARRIRRD